MHQRIGHAIAIVLSLAAVICPVSPLRADSAEAEIQTRVSIGLQFGPAESCQTLPNRLGPAGVCVMGTRPGGAVERAGIRTGDILKQLGVTRVEGAADLLNAVRSLKIGDRPRVVVWRVNEQLTLALEITAQDLVPATPDRSSASPSAIPPLPYRIHPLPVDVKPLLEKVRDLDTAVWVDANVLSIVHRDAREGVTIIRTFQHPMNLVPGTDVWALQLEMSGWERSFFSYMFVAPGAAQRMVPGTGHFRGPDAIPLPELQQNLRGKVHERTLHSRFLNENRSVTVYFPPGARHSGLPILFMADGHSTQEFARAMEPLISSGRAAPFAIVGVHTPLSQFSTGEGYDVSQDRRSQEYLAGIAPDAYARHMRFFIEEVVPWASREYGFSSAREDRAIFGVSNGAAFAAAVGVQHPEVFANALPFSVGFAELPARPTGSLPRFHLIAGELEPAFLVTTRVVRDTLAAWGADATLDVYMSGHDPLMWQAGLVRVMPRVFPAQ